MLNNFLNLLFHKFLFELGKRLLFILLVVLVFWLSTHKINGSHIWYTLVKATKLWSINIILTWSRCSVFLFKYFSFEADNIFLELIERRKPFKNFFLLFKSIFSKTIFFLFLWSQIRKLVLLIFWKQGFNIFRRINDPWKNHAWVVLFDCRLDLFELTTRCMNFCFKSFWIRRKNAFVRIF